MSHVGLYAFMISFTSKTVSSYSYKPLGRRAVHLVGTSAVVLAMSLLGIHLARTATNLPSLAAQPSLTLSAVSPEPKVPAVYYGPAKIRTDRSVYREPALPKLPPAGGRFSDPVFGTEIMRATDAVDWRAPGCSTFYNQWPTFNADNTRLLIRCGDTGDAIIKAFHPETFTIGPTLRKSPTFKGTTLCWEGATWSRADPDLIFVHAAYYDANYPASGMKLYTYRPSTNTFALLKDFGPELAPGQPDYLFEMHVDAHDQIFTLMHKRVGQSEPLYFIVWKRSTDKVLQHIRNDASFDVNNCNPDKSGRWIYFGHNKTQANGARSETWDSQTNTWQTIYWTGADDPGSHGDIGTGILVGHGNFSGGATGRSLSDLHHHTMLFDYKDAQGTTDWSQDQHMTLYADDESWATMALYPEGGPNNTGAFRAEVMQFATDGSQRIRRLFHHRSVIDNLTNTSGYWAIPKPTISRDGRFIAFTSNWGNSGRYDLFIAKVDAAPRLSGLSPKRAAAPSSLVRHRRVT